MSDNLQHKIKREQYGLFFSIADRQRKGKITMSEWATFDNLMMKSGSEYEMAFRVFDVNGTGSVTSEQLQKIYEANRDPSGIPFDFSSDWASLYFGGKGRRHDVTFEEFAQMLRGLQGERIRQAFHLYDTDKDGYIDPEHFQTIIHATAEHKLSDHVLSNLPTLSNISAGFKIPYADVRAFQNIMREMDLLELVIKNVTHKSPDHRTDRTQFLNECARLTRFSQITPKEADVLFHFAGIDSDTGRLSLEDFKKVFDSSWQATKPGPLEDKTTEVLSASKSMFSGVLESLHHFGLGSIAGAFGAFMVYPIDLVKTRMQNQRSTRPGERLYLNSIDCAKKVVRNEGIKGLYSGVLPQLVGVAPEKAIKLTVNDLVRGSFTDEKTGMIPVPAEILAGGTAGACQVVSPFCSLMSYHPCSHRPL
jgi:solute carrier family 25 (mitochondrial aspartate/glutamate transporter), member 12/13